MALRALTRGKARNLNPKESEFYTLPQGQRMDKAYELPSTLREGTPRRRGRKPSARKGGRVTPPTHAESERDEGSSSDEEPESADEAEPLGENPRTETLIPSALVTGMLYLQSKDSWCQKQEWRNFPAGKVPTGRWKGVWSIDRAGLVRRTGVVYVPHDAAVRQEILRVNHDDPWQRGHFGRKRTYEVIRRFYWWPEPWD